MKTKMVTGIILTLFLASMIAFNIGPAQAITIDIAPDTLNVYNTKGNYIAAHIEPSIFFSDTFEDGDATGWTTFGTGGTWAVEDDMMDTVTPNKVYSQEDMTWTTTSEYDTYWRSYTGDTGWTDYVVKAKIKVVDGGFAPIGGIFFRVQGFSSSSDYYLFRIDGRPTWGVALIKSPNTLLAYDYFEVTMEQVYDLKVVVSGSNIKCYVDGELKIDFTDTSYASGAIGVGTFNAHTHFDDVIVTENFDVTTIDVGMVKLWHMMFSDDFEAETVGLGASKWTAVSGEWRVEYDGGNVYSVDRTLSPNVEAITVAGDVSWKNYTLEYKVKITEDGIEREGSAFVRADANAQNGYLIHPQAGTGTYQGYVALWKRVGGSYTLITRAWGGITSDIWHTIKVVLQGDNIRVYVDGATIPTIDYTDTTSPFLSGRIGLRLADNRHAHFDDVVVLSHIADALLEPTLVSDYDNDLAPDREVKFDRAVVAKYLYDNGLTSGEVELVVTGQADGADFAGSDSVRVIAKGKCRF